jgi:hypothetical protein
LIESTRPVRSVRLQANKRRDHTLIEQRTQTDGRKAYNTMSKNHLAKTEKEAPRVEILS